MHDAKQAERAPVHYTMKTSTHKQAVSKAQMASGTPAHTRHAKPSKTTTPIASPRTPYSVGQNHAPKLSPAREPEPRAPSPNYFGLVVDPPTDSRESSAPGRNNWSPPSSSIKSFNAAIPAHMPLDANPDFEAFKRQVEANQGRSFAPSTIGNNHLSLGAQSRPRPSRWNTHASDAAGRSISHSKEKSISKAESGQDSPHDSAYVSSDSKRNSESSFFPLSLGSLPKFESPAPVESQSPRTNLTRSEDRDPRLSLMEHRPEVPPPTPGLINRSSTLPQSAGDNGQSDMITGDKLKTMIKNMNPDCLLLLDIRSAQNYAQSRIQGALNLCVPTTLLKRATFNIQKLQQTFGGGPGSEKFAKWREMKAIVVYDSHSSNLKDAATAQNLMKKFTAENYSGETCILRGGFSVFQETHPKLIDTGSAAQPTGNGTPSLGNGLAPVIGGVSLPMTANSANPFFSNIRQNMDLADGVGQYEVSRPTGLQSPSLPTWLREASKVEDKGKDVSNKFLGIEKDEKARMQAAYAQFNPKNKQKDCVQLCGVEKGGKNRYKDILPFEHARVKLQGRPAGSCDYINASHLTSARSNKRYIAAQGPLPATFEDFWSVVWEQDVRVIVMLTAVSEGGQVKCHSYWQDRQFGPIRLKALSEKKASLDIDKYRSESTASPVSAGMSEHQRRRANTTTTFEQPAPSTQSSNSQSDTPFVTIRKFALSHADHPFAPMREITHLHFPAWPDFGTPAQPAHLLALIELANVMQRASLPVETSSIMGSLKSPDQPLPAWYDEAESNPNARPMLVHCSAGCGRTGTFCAVDSVIDMLKRKRQAKFAQATAAKASTSPTSKYLDVDGDTNMDDMDGAVSPMTDKQMKWPNASATAQARAFAGSEHIDTSFLKDDTVDLIQSTVEDFREQRLSMVQSLRQFVLCYETILEWAHRINDRSVPQIAVGRARSGSLQQVVRNRLSN